MNLTLGFLDSRIIYVVFFLSGSLKAFLLHVSFASTSLVTMASQTFTRDEVDKHSRENDLRVINDRQVYDLTDLVDTHTEGDVVSFQCAGRDATIDFYNLHRREVVQKYRSLCIEIIRGKRPEVVRMQQ